MSRHLGSETGQKRAQKHEQHTAKAIGGVVNAGSGNKDRKNDVRSDDRGTSVECKSTTKKQFVLKLSDLLVAVRNGILEGRDTLFAIEFVVDRGAHRFVIMEEWKYLEQQRTLDIHSGCREC